MLDIIVLALVVAISLVVAIALVASSLARSRSSDDGDSDLAWTQTSFDEAIRDHLRLKRRNAALREHVAR